MNRKTTVRRHLGFRVMALGAALAWVMPAWTQDGAAGTSMHDAFERAAAQLPEAAASPALQAQADAQRRAARGPFVGPPSVSGDILTRSGGVIEQEARISAAIKWPGEARAGILASARGGDAAKARLMVAQLDLAGDIRAAYWRLAGARSAVAVEQQHVATARVETQQVTRLMQAGVQAKRDLLVSQAELGSALARLSAAENELADTLAAAEALIGKAPEIFIDEILTSPIDIDNHPVMRAAETRVKVADAKSAYARFSTRPRLEGTIGVRRDRGDPRGSYEDALLVGIAVPLGRDFRAVAEASGTRSEALSANAEVPRIRARLIAEQRAAMTRLSVAERALDQAQARQSALREAFTLTERGRAEGEIGYIEYLRARQALFDADRDLGAARVAKSAAISRVNQTMGVLP